MFSSTLSLTPALDVGWVVKERHAPAALPPGKTRYPLYRRLDGPRCRSGRVWKISPLLGFDPRTVQPVASQYKAKGKGKILLRTGHEGPEGEQIITLLFL